MTKLERIERQIQGLNRAELKALREWFQWYDADEWDRHIEEDALSGRLDKLSETALKRHKAGQTTEL